MTYQETAAKYETGLISKEEANSQIDFLNMGSDCYYYEHVR